MADAASLDALWRSMGNSGDRPVGWFGPGGSADRPNYTGVSSIDPSRAIEEAIKRQQEAVAPAITSYEAQKPEISAKYTQTREQLQAQQPSLEQRYQNLLTSIKSQGEQDVASQTKITSGELGKRGLTGSSTLAQQEIQNAVTPLRQKYTGLEQETGLAKEDALRQLRDQIAGLTTSETSDLRAISNAIAQLQAGAGQTGASQGIQLYSTQLQNQLAQQQLEEQKRQNTIAEALQKLQTQSPQYMSLGEGSSVFDPTTGKIIATAPKTYKDLQSQLGWE